MNIINIEHISKLFGDKLIFDDASFGLQEGDKVGIVGINGTGKSTLLRMVAGEETPDSGQIIRQNNLKMAYLPQTPEFPKDATVLSYALSGDEEDWQVQSNLVQLGITEYDAKLDTLSGGQRRRIDIARALLHRPRLLILDEPTTGLDPQTRSLLWQVVAGLRQEENLTVFLTTHYMEEAADAGYVVLLDHGRIAAEGTPLQLKNAYAHDTLTLYGVGEADVRRLGLPYAPAEQGWRVTVPDPAAAAELIRREPALFRDFELTKGRMDDVFLAVTGKKLAGGAEK